MEGGAGFRCAGQTSAAPNPTRAAASSVVSVSVSVVPLLAPARGRGPPAATPLRPRTSAPYLVSTSYERSSRPAPWLLARDPCSSAPSVCRRLAAAEAKRDSPAAWVTRMTSEGWGEAVAGTERLSGEGWGCCGGAAVECQRCPPAPVQRQAHRREQRPGWSGGCAQTAGWPCRQTRAARQGVGRCRAGKEELRWIAASTHARCPAAPWSLLPPCLNPLRHPAPAHQFQSDVAAPPLVARPAVRLRGWGGEPGAEAWGWPAPCACHPHCRLDPA